VLNRDDLVEALTAIKVSAPVRADEVTGSTNATVRAMAEAGEPQWSLAAAGHQTEGRGRLGRTWVDVPGRALIFSVLLRPNHFEPNRAGLLTLLAGASMAGAIREETGMPVACKWPNDLLLDHAKVGGILAESGIEDEHLRYVVLGVGVNLDPPKEVPEATGIGDAGERRLLTAFLKHFRNDYVTEDQSLASRVRSAWLPLSATIGRSVEATTTTGRVVRGRAFSLDDFGSLLLSTDEGERPIAFGEIEHLEAPV
jgi:BirA family transcriptional regulator, biotin operon repressor / biotin---[acetyl-CoA-carboxylase] ligase